MMMKYGRKDEVRNIASTGGYIYPPVHLFTHVPQLQTDSDTFGLKAMAQSGEAALPFVPICCARMFVAVY